MVTVPGAQKLPLVVDVIEEQDQAVEIAKTTWWCSLRGLNRGSRNLRNGPSNAVKFSELDISLTRLIDTPFTSRPIRTRCLLPALRSYRRISVCNCLAWFRPLLSVSSSRDERERATRQGECPPREALPEVTVALRQRVRAEEEHVSLVYFVGLGPS